MNDIIERDPRLTAIPDTHGHAKGEHKPYAEERPLPLTARMLFLWFFHACRRGYPRFLMVADHMNYLTFEDPAAVNLVRRALKLAQAGDLYGAAETAGVDVGHAAVVSEGLRRGMRYSIGAEVDNDPRSRPDAQNIVDAMRPDAMIRSIHFIPITHPVHGENWPWPFDNPEFAELFETVGTERTWELYIAALIDAIERLPGHIVGHFYVPAVFGHWPDEAKLEAYEDRVLDAIAARGGMAIEFNTRFLYRQHDDGEKRRYLEANTRLLRKAKERGIGIAIGSDAHSPKDQGAAFDVVLEVLDRLDINEIVFPLGGQLRRVALRVVREPEPEPPPAEPPKPVEAQPPVRKARAAAGAARDPETAPARPSKPPKSDAPPAAPPEPPAANSARRPKSPPRAEEPAPAEQPAPASPRANVAKPAAPTPGAKAGPGKAAPPKATAKAAPAKSAAKAGPAKASPAKAGPVKAVPGKAAPAKAARAKTPSKAVGTKHAPRAAVAKARPVRPAAKSSASKPAAKKVAAARPTAKKTAPARPTAAKRAVTTKKAAPKKAAPRRDTAKSAPAKAAASKARPAKKAAPARKASPAKKATPKKTPAKRR